MSARPVTCGCEHHSHDDDPAQHAMFGVPAGTRHASYVGPICDACADGHYSRYVIGEIPPGA